MNILLLISLTLVSFAVVGKGMPAFLPQLPNVVYIAPGSCPSVDVISEFNMVSSKYTLFLHFLTVILSFFRTCF